MWLAIQMANFPGQTNVGGSDSFIRKYNSDGDEEWTRQFGTSGGVSTNGVAARLHQVECM